MNKVNKVNMPKEHPILRNVFACIFCLLVVAPIIIALLGRAVDYKNSKSLVLSEETVGQVLEYTLITDKDGNTLEFNTTVIYEVDGIQYSKVYKTDYYVAEGGQFIKMYYEKGNPYSASVTKEETNFGLKAKTDLYTLICMVMILFFSFNAYQDVIKAKQRQIMWAQTQMMMQNGVNMNPMGNQMSNIGNMNNFGSMNNMSNINNMTPKW